MDVRRPVLQLVMETSIGPCMGISFTPDSQSFLIGCYDGEDPSAHFYDVYRLNGQLIASFEDDPDSSEPCWAIMADGRVAIAHTACFKIYSLSSGQVLAIAGPDTTKGEMSDTGGGQIAVSPSGNKLAFIPALEVEPMLTVHIYDAGTLQQIACLQPGPADAGKLDAMACWSLSSALFWGVHGYMLAYVPSSGNESACGHLQILVPQAGSDKYQQAVLHGCEPRQPLALSPCASFVLLYDQHSVALQVRDVRNGKLVISQAVGLPRNACAKYDLKYDLKLLWSKCGSRLVARVRAKEAGSLPRRWASERLVVVQIM